MSNTPSHYERIRQDLHRRWRRRFLWVSHFAVALLSIPISFTVSPYDRSSFVLMSIGLIGTCFFHALYLIFAELRDRALRKAIEKERRWELLERLAAKGEDQQTLAHLLLEEDDQMMDEFYHLQDQPKRKNR